MKKILLSFLLALPLVASAIDVEVVRKQPADKCHQDALGACQVWNGGTTTFYNSTGSKQVWGGAGGVVNVAAQSGTSVTVQFFDDADGTCDTNAKGGTIGLTADAAPLQLGWEFTYGICMLVGGTSPEVTVVTLP